MNFVNQMRDNELKNAQDEADRKNKAQIIVQQQAQARAAQQKLDDAQAQQKRVSDLATKFNKTKELGESLIIKFADKIADLEIPEEFLDGHIELSGSNAKIRMLRIAGFDPQPGEVFPIEGIHNTTLKMLTALLLNSSNVDRMGPFNITDNGIKYYGFQLKVRDQRVQNFVFRQEMGDVFLGYYGEGNTVQEIPDQMRNSYEAILEQLIDEQRPE